MERLSVFQVHHLIHSRMIPPQTHRYVLIDDPLLMQGSPRQKGGMKMRLPTRQMLILVTCVGIWVGMLILGNYFLGSIGVATNAVLIGGACGFLFQMLNRWQNTTWTERSRYAVAVLVFFAATLTFQQFAFSQGLGLERELEREVQRLNEKVQDLPQFSSVEFWLAKQGWVCAGGSVPSRRDLDNLHAVVDELANYGQVYWYVDVKK